jgi:hypothetical protein
MLGGQLYTATNTATPTTTTIASPMIAFFMRAPPLPSLPV